MLSEEIRKELEKIEITAEEIERVESILSKYDILSNELVKELYSDMNTRRAMKNKGFWDDKTTGLEFANRYLGEGKVDVTRQRLWIKGDKVRIYFDITVDEQFLVPGNWVKIK